MEEVSTIGLDIAKSVFRRMARMRLTDDRFRVVTCHSAFGRETLKADMAVRCLDRPLSKISI